MKSSPKASDSVDESCARHSVERAALKSEPNTAGDSISRREAFRLAAVATTASILTIHSPDRSARAGMDTLVNRTTRRTTGTSAHKSIAMSDYAANMVEFGGRLASPVQSLWSPCARSVPWQFDVIVVGSGYGASITAARLARRMRAGCRLAVLERGREWVPGTFPDTTQDMIEASRYRLFVQKQDVRNPHGLFSVRQFNEISVLSGSGLGGSSLINASVAIRPDNEVFYQPWWPSPLRDRMFLDPYFDIAEWELGTIREPSDWTDKMRSQRVAAERLRDCGAHFEAAALTLTRGPRCSELPIINRQGLRQRACIDCGDCLNGCNVGAKNTLAMNYLPAARRAGAELYTQIEVRCVEKCNGFYRVHADYYPEGSQSRQDAIPVQLTSRIVVLGCGSLGSTEILMRSANPGMVLSGQLGMRWTGNGDALGFIRKTQCRTGIAGFGAYDTGALPVGPTIETNVTYPYRPDLQSRVLVQEGAATRAYVNALGLLMQDLDLENTQILLGMGHDGCEGRISMDGDNVRLDWPGLTQSAYREHIRNEFRRIAAAHGGEYKFLRVFGDKMISVHPLGGCGMGENATCGVVNHKGQVFDARYGGDIDSTTGQHSIHSGLYVCDGSIIPTSIACNPLLTISAIAERNAEMLTMEPEYQDLFQPSMPR